MLYFWGADPDTGIAIVQTKDTHDEDHPIKPLPKWPYLLFVLEHLASGAPKLIVDKPRQLMISWLMLLWLDYVCLVKMHRRCLLNKATFTEAEHMLYDRLGIVHASWPQWFADWAQIREWRTTGEMLYGRTGSSIQATGENVQDRASRGDQASIVFVDEAARHPYLREIIAAIAPMSKQIILVSTPETGSDGSRWMDGVLCEGRDIT